MDISLDTSAERARCLAIVGKIAAVTNCDPVDVSRAMTAIETGIDAESFTGRHVPPGAKIAGA